jgi:alpha-beta hydrolase superfamily lysophospholipase
MPAFARRVLRLVINVLWFVLGALVVIALGDTLYSSGLRDLRPWHTERLDGEFRAGMAKPGFGLKDYFALEDRLFAQVDALKASRFDAALDGTVSRFNPAGHPFARRLDRDWNRSYVLHAAPERGVALLLHGLSDSPYSLRTTAAALHADGITVYGLRLPGHGTLPGELDRADWPDWDAAVAMALAEIRASHAGKPLFVVGYSTGAALAVKNAADTVAAGRLDELPRHVFLLSPALGVSRFAKLANVQRIITTFGVAPKSRWTNVDLEIDPFKYQSFTKNAGAQVALLVDAVVASLGRVRAAGSAKSLPPFMSFQSAVDQTVIAADLVDRLYGAVDNPASELVLFDLNRLADLEAFLTFSPKALIDAFQRNPDRGYRFTVVTNAANDVAEVAELTSPAHSQQVTRRLLDLAWPKDVFSLSHVALPFPRDDPVYGDAATGPGGRLITLGTLQMRGEKNVLAVSAGDQLRLRSNPFHAYQIERIRAAIAADLAARPAAK